MATKKEPETEDGEESTWETMSQVDRIMLLLVGNGVAYFAVKGIQAAFSKD